MHFFTAFIFQESRSSLLFPDITQKAPNGLSREKWEDLLFQIKYFYLDNKFFKVTDLVITTVIMYKNNIKNFTCF